MRTREEAHWSSFRNAVLGLQNNLGRNHEHGHHPPVPKEVMGSTIVESEKIRSGALETNGMDNEPNSSRRKGHQSALLPDAGAANSNTLRHYSIESPKPRTRSVVAADDFLTTIPSWDSKKTMETIESPRGGATTTTTRLELTGLEQVDKGASTGILLDAAPHSSPGNTSSGIHAAQSSQSHHTAAEQQLAEVKLRLFLTEEERDELEFQLMQK
mmetsp:Transcript_872/g.1813  ORF Transcript_872/g.1813 Transcript_872/m.1813 type:complete len:214 (+) Transcript_872:152-793(+)|eukprot:CAMPEP_0183720118 /NCGR_PEP_ID=MMETSP0737-20130205/12827_1 /TAXON_ID=385413 /ORGANISM="Thalassiosira miniscula, Strain CCMP1093" /LENGTH=213 /DNA_ID=CAMNT_0025949933 /DNA_START=103 /DNA_END=744 /DNA_ORIENTATION=+